MEKKVYGVFVGKQAYITFNKKIAITSARRYGREVRVMAWNQYFHGGRWDWPTFRVISDHLWP